MFTESPVEDALDALREGRPVLVLDDVDREDEGDVVLAAQTVTPSWLAWTIRHTSGYLCAPMPEAWADRLDLPLMVTRNEDSLRTAYTVTVDAARGVTTGISATDRATTLHALADPAALPHDLVRPGHVVPLRARDGGVLVRRGHTEAAVDLCRLAGLSPVGAIGELVHDSGEMMRAPAVFALAAEHDLPVVTIAALVRHRQAHDRVRRQARTVVPTRHGRFAAYGYRDELTGAEHLALVSPRGLGEAPLVRVHSECLTGDAFGSLRCDCGPQLEHALARVAAEGGAVVYLRGHEGRGVGLLGKLAAYREQDLGADTVEAQELLGLPVDARDFAAGAAILHDLAIRRVRLLTNNPGKADAVRAAGLDVVTVEPSHVGANPDNERYLRTKRDRLGHLLPATSPTHQLAQEA
ncbi:bifunctional 3,4-dihydroxy-2-butanone-4-phosphate synthase/GTP cyclohydrolase II [Arsenicicoccus sp. oral taxon 190]|uniref:bifunctional 3,4-dihydroxy-2-butanone-4-phosphate synthase/GTP cyclohydrolase II n=1 Tax=Arsenicicoccus sp. oral taxon 190 TaxID=1658671 RepID=UPI00067A2152|nr:bifunctional 3,4-dihydroxy-2-butanone-4-phosphate synthase/GTP cyclohydrolase II [Arsenicicoccus sp. oral taxon 190]AKT51971.1 GTP cyclohydrolase [Arsenicicoccus sp. oral taxon 190]